jgi:transcriptional regulator with XRE-family HTH domain
MTKDEMRTFLKNERNKQGLSLRALGERAGIRAATVYEYESKGTGTLKTVLAIVDALSLKLTVEKSKI